MAQEKPTVLVGIDGSDDGMRAARYGVGRCLSLDGILWLVNAVDDGAASGGWGMAVDRGVLKEAGEGSLLQAKDLAISLGVDPAQIRTEAVVGHPVAVLAELSKSAELLVVGRRASSGLERMFVGSTSTSLATASHCPLIVISAASTPQPTGSFQKIAVAMGGSGDRALRWACQEAATRGAGVDVIHVIPYQPTSIATFLPTSAAQDRQWELRVMAGLEQMVDPVREQFDTVEITVRSQRGVLTDELILESARVDLLVLGVKPRGTVMLGGPVRAVLAHSCCPVALISR